MLYFFRVCSFLKAFYNAANWIVLVIKYCRTTVDILQFFFWQMFQYLKLSFYPEFALATTTVI